MEEKDFICEEKEIEAAQELEAVVNTEAVVDDEPLDKNIKLMSPTRMVMRRFFRSKLSVIGLVMVVGLFLFSFLGPVVYTKWGEEDIDRSGRIDYSTATVEVYDKNNNEVFSWSSTENYLTACSLSSDGKHLAVSGLMTSGGRLRSVIISFNVTSGEEHFRKYFI